MRSTWAVMACALLVAGCGSEYTLMIAPEHPGSSDALTAVKPKGRDCDFEVTNGLPAAVDYEEIARLDAEFSPAASLDQLKATVHDQVCSIGGDVLVGEWDGSHFMAAIVYRFRGQPAAAVKH